MKTTTALAQFTESKAVLHGRPLTGRQKVAVLCMAVGTEFAAKITTGLSNDEAATYPDGVFIGPMVALLDENSASDGDIFPAMFREAGLGPLIGKRSWGGVVGITNRGQLIDGGVVKKVICRTEGAARKPKYCTMKVIRTSLSQ